jgi:hypothetical protein
VVPVIVTMDPADAQTVTSPPPEPPGQREPQDSSQVGAPPRTEVTDRPVKEEGDRGELALTGMNLDHLAKAGLAATAGGAALMLWSADAKAAAPKPAAAAPEPAEPDART